MGGLCLNSFQQHSLQNSMIKKLYSASQKESVEDEDKDDKSSNVSHSSSSKSSRKSRSVKSSSQEETPETRLQKAILNR